MSHDWFKMHNDFINDPKMKRYFTKSERLDWVNLLCLSSKSRERGVLTMPDDEISYALDLEDEEWLALREKLIDRKMVAIREVDDALVILNWDERQYDKPSDAPAATAERKRRSRAAQSGQIVPDVTRTSRAVTPSHATDKRRGEESISSPPTPNETEAVMTTETKPFSFDDPLPIHVQNFLAESCPNFYEAHLRLSLTGRSPNGIGNYSMEILRGWKAGKNAPQGPLPDPPSPSPLGGEYFDPNEAERKRRMALARSRGTFPGGATTLPGGATKLPARTLETLAPGERSRPN